MDRLTTYRTILKEVLSQQAEIMRQGPQKESETQLTFDEERDQYLLLRLGWTTEGRIFVPAIYARLQNGKIWIENDWTETGLATGLIEHGVPPSDVVLASHEPAMRQYTEFAVA